MSAFGVAHEVALTLLKRSKRMRIGILFTIHGFQHMEDHVDKYPRASVREVCAKVSEELQKIKARGNVPFFLFRSLRGYRSHCLRCSFCSNQRKRDNLHGTRMRVPGSASGV